MDQLEQLAISRETFSFLQHLFSIAITTGKWNKNQFDEWVNEVLLVGLTCQALITSGRCKEEVFEDVPSIVITSTNGMFSLN